MPLVQADRLTHIGAALLRAAVQRKRKRTLLRPVALMPISPATTRTG